MEKQTKTIQERLKNKHDKLLCDLTFATNQVWNYCNNKFYDTWYVPVPEVGCIKGVWLPIFDMNTIVKPLWSGILLFLKSYLNLSKTINIVVYYEEKVTESTKAVGIDSGLKVTATTGDGEELIGGKYCYKLE